MYFHDHGQTLPVLHVADIETGFSNAALPTGESAEAVWDSFLTSWHTICTGPAGRQRVYQGSAFTPKNWVELPQALVVELIFSGAESHNSLGFGEQYHAPLRRVNSMVILDHLFLHRIIRPRLPVTSINGTLEPNDLVPSVIVFGTIPPLNASHSINAAQSTCLIALETARCEYSTTVP